MDDTTETTPDAEPASPDTPDADTTDAPDTTQESRNLSREAAAYRHKAKAAREELEKMTARHDTMKRAYVAKLLPDHITPELFFEFAEHQEGIVGDPSDADVIAREVERLEKRFGLRPTPKARGPVVRNAGLSPAAKDAPFQLVQRRTWDDIVKGNPDD